MVLTGWIHLRSVSCSTYTLQNNNMANRLRPIGGPWSLFSKMRIQAGGQILENIDLCNRVREMFNTFSAEGSRYNDYSEGFGHVWEGTVDANALSGVANNAAAVSAVSLVGISGASYQTVLCKPLLGILNQRKYLPLRFMPITLDLLLVDDPLDPIVSNFPNYQAGVAAPAIAFTNVNTSTTWQIQNVQVKCDIVSLDSVLNESYIKLLEEGKKLTLNYNTLSSHNTNQLSFRPISLSASRGH